MAKKPCGQRPMLSASLSKLEGRLPCRFSISYMHSQSESILLLDPTGDRVVKLKLFPTAWSSYSSSSVGRACFAHGAAASAAWVLVISIIAESTNEHELSPWIGSYKPNRIQHCRHACKYQLHSRCDSLALCIFIRAMIDGSA